MGEATGEVEKEDGVLVIRRIHVRYTLALGDGSPEVAERAHTLHAQSCPVYRTISGCVAITTELRFA